MTFAEITFSITRVKWKHGVLNSSNVMLSRSMSAWIAHIEYHHIWSIYLSYCITLQVVADAGHSANEPGIAAELVVANEKLKNIIKNGRD